MSEALGSREAHRPERRCVGCGRRAPQDELLRVVVDASSSPATVVWATGRRRTGRGAYVCPRRACLDRAVQRKAFQRAFRSGVTVDVDGITAAILTAAHGEPNENDTAGE